jgi:hypothetical protein
MEGRDLTWHGVPKRAIAGLFIGLVVFVFSCHSSVTQTENGRLVKCSYIDYAAILGGGIAAAIGFSILAMKPVPLLHRIGYMAVLAALGAVQIVRGLGYLGGPCN